MTQDLAKITTPFGLLDAETQKALKECGGPWETWAAYCGWGRCIIPTFSDEIVYRKKPAPREYVAWQVCRPDGKGWVVYFDDQKDVADQIANAVGGFVVKLTGTRDE